MQLYLEQSVSCALLSFSVVRYEKIKFLVIALKNGVEVYAWAPKPYHKFMAFKVGNPVNTVTRCPYKE